MLRTTTLLLRALALAAAISAPVAADPVAEAIGGSHRSEANRARDDYRHPAQTLEFFGFEPDLRVVEILPGRGWYTEILAPALRDAGELVVASYGADNPNSYLRNVHGALMELLDANPEVFDKVERRLLQDGGTIDLGPVESADLVVTFRSTHNWIRRGGLREAYQAMYRVLKPGGVLGVVQHRAKPGADPRVSAEQGYVPQAWLIGYLEGIGFEFDGASEINANPRDDREHPSGVWSLPPTLRDVPESERERYLAVGESDRMTLRFVKP